MRALVLRIRSRLARSRGTRGGAGPIGRSYDHLAAGSDFHTTLRQRGTYAIDLARLLGAKKDYGGAETLYRRVLAIREKVLGPEHPDTAASLTALGATLALEGD
jgi:hypothetical protein